MANKCIICGLETKGRGNYSFTYLGETVVLCGHHAQRQMLYIKALAKIEQKLVKGESMTKKPSEEAWDTHVIKSVVSMLINKYGSEKINKVLDLHFR